MLYSDSDDGVSQERFISTSRVHRGILGSSRAAAPYTTCEAVDGVLQIVDTQDPSMHLGDEGNAGGLKISF